jgi:hypothetical protein
MENVKYKSTAEQRPAFTLSDGFIQKTHYNSALMVAYTYGLR